MEIKVFGPGCTRCSEVEKLVREVLEAKGDKSTVTKVTDLKEMMAAGVLSTPAVMVDGKIKCIGKVPTKTEIASWLDNNDISTASGNATNSGCACGGKC